MKFWEIKTENGQTNQLPVSRWSEFKKVAGVLIAAVPIDHRASLYAQWGDWLPWGCWAVLGVGLLWSFLPRIGKPARGSSSRG
jgi:hypothetical protein